MAEPFLKNAAVETDTNLYNIKTLNRYERVYMSTWEDSDLGKVLFWGAVVSLVIGAIGSGNDGFLGFAILIILVGIIIGIIDIDSIIEFIVNEMNDHRQWSELQKKKAFEDEQIANGFIKLKDEEGNDTWLGKDEANKLFFDVIKSINEFKHSKNYS